MTYYYTSHARSVINPWQWNVDVSNKSLPTYNTFLVNTTAPTWLHNDVVLIIITHPEAVYVWTRYSFSQICFFNFIQQLPNKVYIYYIMTIKVKWYDHKVLLVLSRVNLSHARFIKQVKELGLSSLKRIHGTLICTLHHKIPN